MIWLLQYYKKNTNLFKVFSVILLHFFSLNVFSLDATFTINQISECPPSRVIFTNQSETGAGISFKWDFGKEGEGLFDSNDELLEQIYTDPGDYIITLYAIEGTDTVSRSDSIHVANGPTAEFTFDETSGCIPLEVNFKSTSTEGSAPISSTIWDLRDGLSYGSSTDLTKIYDQSGIYDVLLTITDQNGCKDYKEKLNIITVFDQPVVDFAPSDTLSCDIPLYVNFINKTKFETNLTYLWDFGNGITSTQRDTGLFYMESGNYNISLTVENENGCKATKEKQNFINVGHTIQDIIAYQADKVTSGSDSMLCQGEVYFQSSIPGNTWNEWIVEYGNKTRLKTGDTILFDDFNVDSVIVTLYYGNGTSCPDTARKVFYLDDFEVDFEIDPVSSTCKFPVLVNYTGQPNGAEQYGWIFPDSEAQGILDTFLFHSMDEKYVNVYNHKINEYEFPITFYAIDKYGCMATKEKEFMAELPLARFMPDKVGGCAPLDVEIEDKSESNQNITERKYIINGETIEKSDNSSFTYTFENPGHYSIIKMIMNEEGCADTSFTMEILVGDKVNPDITLNDAKLCVGDTLMISGTAEMMDSLGYWHFSSNDIFNISGNSPDVEIMALANKPGNKDVFVETVYNGCPSDTLIKNAFYVSGPAGDFHPEFSCDSSYIYSFNSVIEQATSLTWYLDDTIITGPDTLEYAFNRSGDYYVRLNAQNDTSGCELDVGKRIKVRKVTAHSGTDDIICSLRMELDASKSNDVLFECYNEGFLWEFGDNSRPDRVQNEMHFHNYPERGDYLLKLTAKADNGCTDTLSRMVKIIDLEPEYEVNKDFGCYPQMEIEFTKTSEEQDLLYWKWYFDDEQDRLLGKTVSHTYNATEPGYYHPVLEVVDKYGCKGHTTKTIEMYRPDASFYAERPKICEGEQAHFVIYETDYAGFEIDFGDGSNSTSSLYHTYNDVGDYDIEMTVTKRGCSFTSTRSKYITVVEANAEYTVNHDSSNCYPVTVQFDHDNSTPISSGIWRYGDDNSSSQYNSHTQYTYTKPGTYNTSLTIKTFNGCIAAFDKDIYIAGPEATFSFSPILACYGDPVNFTIEELIETESYYWYFGDGDTATIENPVHRYYADGTIEPILYVKNGDCNVAVSNGSLFVSDLKAGFSVENSGSKFCQLDNINVNNTSVNPTTISWILNGEEISTDDDPGSIVLSNSGNNILEQIVRRNNCIDTAISNIEVFPLPEFQIEGEEVICKGESGVISVTQQSGWSIEWLPDSNLNNPNSFSHTISPENDITYRATVLDGNNCSSTRYFNIIVPEELEFARNPVGDTIINYGESVLLSVFSSTIETIFQWEPDTRLSCSDCSSPIASPRKNTTYTVTMKDRCNERTASFFIEVYDEYYIEAPTAFTPNGDGNNDDFYLETFNIDEIIEFKIFNRWGNLVFATNNLDEGWDGTVGGKLQNADTYAWFVKAITIFGFEVTKNGSVILLK